MNPIPKDGKLYLDQSRIYRSGIDEEYYQSNLLYSLIKEWSFMARVVGDETLDNIKRCMTTDLLHEQHYFAYFAGVAARRAFSIAGRLLDLDAERQKVLGNGPTDWRKL